MVAQVCIKSMISYANVNKAAQAALNNTEKRSATLITEQHYETDNNYHGTLRGKCTFFAQQPGLLS